MDVVVLFGAVSPMTGPRVTLIGSLAAEIAGITRRTSAALSDRKMSQWADELFAATTNLVHAHATNEKDLAAKLEVLCRRLREFLDPNQRGEVLTALLAGSVRDGVVLLASSAVSNSQRADASRRANST